MGSINFFRFAALLKNEGSHHTNEDSGQALIGAISISTTSFHHPPVPPREASQENIASVNTSMETLTNVNLDSRYDQ